MKRLLPRALLALALAGGSAQAAENWSAHLPGVTAGMAAGALPPPGVYFVNNTLVAPFTLYDRGGHKTPVKADVFVDVPILLWNPGITVLGASYAAAIAQPMTYVNSKGGGLNRSDFGAFSTIVIPGNLSWALPNNFHVLAGLAVYLPTGTAQKTVISYPNGTYAGVPNSINYWVIEPSLGVSWLADGWNVSASLNFDFNFENKSSGYRTGTIIVGDYTVTKTIDKWTLGLTGYSVNQIESDKSKHAAVQAGINASGGNKQTKYAIGPTLGYNFGPVTLSVSYQHGFGAKNTLSGDLFWTRLLFRF